MSTTSDAHALDAIQAELELPDHHGRRPAGMRSKLTGASNQIVSAHEIGDTVYLFVEAKVKDAGHSKTAKQGLLYVEKLAVEALHVLDPEMGRNLDAGFRQQYRAADDARHGRTPLFECRVPSRVVWADSSGYVLSEEDLAEIRGEEPPPASDEQLAAAEDREAHEQLVAPQWLRAVDSDGDTAGYDQLSGPQVIAAARVVDDRSVIAACLAHERASKDRKGVTAALSARVDELAEPAE